MRRTAGEDHERNPSPGAGDGLDDLDGFYTVAVGTKDGSGVLRDPIAREPAVLAETDQYATGTGSATP